MSGRWSNDYPEGTTNPLDWTGSGPILEEFWTTKKTVKYGQCWVFSGLVTTCKSMKRSNYPARLHKESASIYVLVVRRL